MSETICVICKKPIEGQPKEFGVFLPKLYLPKEIKPTGETLKFRCCIKHTGKQIERFSRTYFENKDKVFTQKELESQGWFFGCSFDPLPTEYTDITPEFEEGPDPRPGNDGKIRPPFQVMTWYGFNPRIALALARIEKEKLKTALWQISNAEPYPNAEEGFKRVIFYATKALKEISK